MRSIAGFAKPIMLCESIVRMPSEAASAIARKGASKSDRVCSIRHLNSSKQSHHDCFNPFKTALRDRRTGKNGRLKTLIIRPWSERNATHKADLKTKKSLT